MNLLLDTHVFLWWAGDSERLSPTIRERLADRQNRILVSIASLWEIQIKQQLGKLILSEPWEAIVERERTVNGIELLSIEFAHLVAMNSLAVRPEHRDPIDRLLIAQAVRDNLTLVSVDPEFRNYPVSLLE